MRTSLRTICLVPFLCLLPIKLTRGQQPPAPVVRSGELDLSELMITIQLRHIKLWFSGKLGNWMLANYQLDLLSRDLKSAAKVFPAGLSGDDTARQIISVRDAVDAKDLIAFRKAYSELTNTCNGCHRAAGRGFISVQVPAVSPFTDQDFADVVAEGRTLAHTMCGICHAVPDKPNAPLSLRFSAPSFVELVRQPSFTESSLRQLLTSEHRRVGPDQTMPNPRLNDTQIDAIVAYFEALKLEQKKTP
jgi:cytochrome c553